MCVFVLLGVCVREDYCFLLCGNFASPQCTESEESCEESRENLNNARRSCMKDEWKYCQHPSRR